MYELGDDENPVEGSVFNLNKVIFLDIDLHILESNSLNVSSYIDYGWLKILGFLVQAPVYR